MSTDDRTDAVEPAEPDDTPQRAVTEATPTGLQFMYAVGIVILVLIAFIVVTATIRNNLNPDAALAVLSTLFTSGVLGYFLRGKGGGSK